MELYVHSDQTVKEIIDIAHSFNVDAKVVGYVEAAKQKKLTIKSKYGEFIYWYYGRLDIPTSFFYNLYHTNLTWHFNINKYKMDTE